jgi:hypothetical protein
MKESTMSQNHQLVIAFSILAGFLFRLAFRFSVQVRQHFQTSSQSDKKIDNPKREWRQDGQLHREDGPAIIYSNGTVMYYRHGKLHREDGPAIIYSNGDQWYYRDGKLYREDGPAVFGPSGWQMHYRDGQLHREDGPAIIYSNGNQYYYRDGLIHRKDGPAVIESDGACSYFKDGILHRDNGPAVIKANGQETYYRDGKLHREDGPALVTNDGRNFYYRDGKLHREDGPACEWADGTKWWYRDGVRFFPETEIDSNSIKDSFEALDVMNASISITLSSNSEEPVEIKRDARFDEAPVYPDDFWSVKAEGTFRISILPFRNGNEFEWSVTRKQHYIKVSDSTKVVQCQKRWDGENWGGDCHLCDLQKRYWAFFGMHENGHVATDVRKMDYYSDAARKIKAQPRHYINVAILDQNDVCSGPFVYSISESLFQQIDQNIKSYIEVGCIKSDVIQILTESNFVLKATKRGEHFQIDARLSVPRRRLACQEQILRLTTNSWDLEKVVAGWGKTDEEIFAEVEEIERIMPSHSCQKCERSMPSDSITSLLCSECLQKETPQEEKHKPCLFCDKKFTFDDERQIYCSESCLFDANIRKIKTTGKYFGCTSCGTTKIERILSTIYSRYSCGLYRHGLKGSIRGECSMRPQCKCDLLANKGCSCGAPNILVAGEFYSRLKETTKFEETWVDKSVACVICARNFWQTDRRQKYCSVYCQRTNCLFGCCPKCEERKIVYEPGKFAAYACGYFDHGATFGSCKSVFKVNCTTCKKSDCVCERPLCGSSPPVSAKELTDV